MNKFTILLGFVLLFGLSCGNQERKAAADKPLQKQPEKPGHYNSTTKNSDTLNLEHYKRSDFSKALQKEQGSWNRQTGLFGAVLRSWMKMGKYMCFSQDGQKVLAIGLRKVK